MAELRRRCCVESPDLAIAYGDPTGRVSDLHNRLDHALHLFGETVPFGENTLVLRPHTAICFDRHQGLDPFGELCSGFVQTVPRERRVVHFATRELQVVAGEQRVQRMLSSRLGRKVGSRRRCLDLSKGRAASPDVASSANAAAIRASKLLLSFGARCVGGP